jgi:glycosyltransferase involved in cell wall biosynthesis
MRVFHLEPFLRRTESHFVEVALAMNSHFRETSNRFQLVGNKGLEDSVKRLFPNVVPGISQTCFEDPENKGISFAQDLFHLHQRFDFQEDDLIIVSTSYENQILGTAIYQTEAPYPPSMALHFHQLFPPSSDSDDIAKLSFRKLWQQRLKQAFSRARFSKVSYWTTESSILNHNYTRLSQQRVGMLPVPFLSNPSRTRAIESDRVGTKYRVGYLGDGRQEKGLLTWLRVIRAFEKTPSYYEFVVQINNPRGFNNHQRSELDELLLHLRNNPNLHFINGQLSPKEFHRLLQSLDLIAIPYNPLNYFRRVSGLAMHAAVYERPVLASSGTWAAEAVTRGHLAGKIFDYNTRNEELTINNAVAAVRTALAQRSELKRTAMDAAAYFRTRNTPAEYLKRIDQFYSQQRRLI